MKKLGTFEGVFLPALLTIVGVVVFIRLGWVVGNIGIGQTFLVIILAHITTITTALSVSSIATNTKLGEGGVYYILSRSFGFEIGGVVGVFLYCTQVFGCALYVLGFTEVWIGVFPEHDPKWVSGVSFACLFIASYFMASLTLRLQYFIFGVIILSIGAFFIGKYPTTSPEHFKIAIDIHLNKDFWYYFAIFFPAVTGLESGISMSGDLKDPKKSMPIGTMMAVFAGFLIYMLAAYIYSWEADPKKLQNTMYMADNAYSRPLVLFAMLAATLSSAIGTIMAAPRILAAMAKDNVIPFKGFFAKKNKKGEPTMALLFSALIMYLSMNVGDLNRVAGILTMFFLVGYFSINLGLFIEKMIDSPSFRPYFNIPSIIPLIGFTWSAVVAFLVEPLMAFICIFLSFVLYFVLLTKHLRNDSGDMRYSFFNMLGEWAIKKTHQYPSGKKNWKPNFLIPIDEPSSAQEKIDFIHDLVSSNGSVRLFTVFINKDVDATYTSKSKRPLSFLRDLIRDNEGKDEKVKEALLLEEALADLVDPFDKKHIFATYQLVESSDLYDSFNVTTQIMKGMPFPPNILFMTMSENETKDEQLKRFIRIGINNRLGILILFIHPDNRFGEKKKIDVWLRHGSPNIHLIILISNILAKAWGARIRLISVLDSEDDRSICDLFLNKIMEAGRMIRSTEKLIQVGGFMDILKSSEADLNIFGSITNEVDLDPIRSVTSITKSSCIFLKDSGSESAMV